MNLKQGYRIVDSSKGGEVRKKSKIKDNGWRGFIDTPDDQKADYLWNYANEQEKLSGELNKMQRDFVDVFAKEKPGSVIYEKDEDGGGINYYDTLRYAKWRDPDFKEVYAKNIQPFESDLNRRTADINMMNEHLGYPIGFESGHKPYWIKKQGIGDSARVSDSAEASMVIAYKFEGVDGRVKDEIESEFNVNNPQPESFDQFMRKVCGIAQRLNCQAGEGPDSIGKQNGLYKAFITSEDTNDNVYCTISYAFVDDAVSTKEVDTLWRGYFNEYKV